MKECEENMKEYVENMKKYVDILDFSPPPHIGSGTWKNSELFPSIYGKKLKKMTFFFFLLAQKISEIRG